jgi:hypothetical protein
MNGTSSICRVFIRTGFRQKKLGLSGFNDEFQEQSCRSWKEENDIMRCKTKPAMDDIYKLFSQYAIFFRFYFTDFLLKGISVSIGFLFPPGPEVYQVGHY